MTVLPFSGLQQRGLWLRIPIDQKSWLWSPVWAFAWYLTFEIRLVFFFPLSIGVHMPSMLPSTVWFLPGEAVYWCKELSRSQPAST